MTTFLSSESQKHMNWHKKKLDTEQSFSDHKKKGENLRKGRCLNYDRHPCRQAKK